MPRDRPRESEALTPDVRSAAAEPITGVRLEVTGSVPIVFASVYRPGRCRYVKSLARLGGNAHGLTGLSKQHQCEMVCNC